MNQPVFIYNNPNAECVFCRRTHNPHPDYDHEPVVTALMPYNDKNYEICINCYDEILEVSDKTGEPLTSTIKDKVNVARLVGKSSLF